MDFEKQAAEAINMLIEKGVDFDTAVSMVEKQAGIMKVLNTETKKALKKDTLKEVGKLGAAAGTGAAGLYAGKKLTPSKKPDALDKKMEKQSAINMLIENGVDFDTAVNLVQAKAKELE